MKKTGLPAGDCGGLILCGGRSRRMGHDKARLRFPGGTLLHRVLGRMAQVADPIVISLAHGQAIPPEAEGVMTTQDSEADQGPLWGLLEGFRALAPHCSRLMVMPVDMPFFTVDCMRRLAMGLEGHEACLFEHEGFVNALTAAYDLSLLERLEGLVAEGKRRPIFLPEGRPTRVLRVDDASISPGRGHPLDDVDTPEAYRDALLTEGVGVPGGAEVTISVQHPDGREDIVALYADTAESVLENLRVLYPEHPDLFPPGAIAGLSDFGGEKPGVEDADPRRFENPLRSGQRLALNLMAVKDI